MGTASLTSGLLLPRLARSQPAAARTLVPRETFFGDPDVASAQLSFDGALVGYVAPVDGVRNLWVAPVDDPAAARPVTRVTDRPISSFVQWAYTNRHVVLFQERDGTRTGARRASISTTARSCRSRRRAACSPGSRR